MCSLNIGAQVGSCEKEISIQDDKMAGSLVKPKASVNYYEESGNGIYGLIIT